MLPSLMLRRSIWTVGLIAGCGGSPPSDKTDDPATGGVAGVGGGDDPAAVGGSQGGGSQATGGQTSSGGNDATGGSPANGGGTNLPGTGGSGVNGGGAGGEPSGIGGAGVDPLAPHLLLFTHTAGFRHSSIEDGIALFISMAEQEGWTLHHSEDPSAFNALGLADVSCVVFLSTTGDILGEAEQSAFEDWFASGGAFVGIHAATDTEYEWPFYTDLVGAQFKSHPAIQTATVVVEDTTHPATAHLDSSWSRSDEWYDFVHNPRENVHVLLSLDETTYDGGTMGADHPIAWSQELAGGRSFYTALGHTSESYGESDYIQHLRGGLRWALRLAD